MQEGQWKRSSTCTGDGLDFTGFTSWYLCTVHVDLLNLPLAEPEARMR